MAHGGGVMFGYAARHPCTPPGETGPLDPGGFRGFSYLLGAPARDVRSQWADDLRTAKAVFEALYSSLPFGEARDNRLIPAGYTYLLQLVSHDLVASSEPLWVASEAGIPVVNARVAPLQLETLYGGGPTLCPLAFQQGEDGPAPDYSTKLRLGRIADAGRRPLAPQCTLRDLARVTSGPAPGIANGPGEPPAAPARRHPEANFDDPAQLYIADVRNGDGPILSQLVVLFAIVHNAIADKLGQVRGRPAAARYAYARAATLHIYHSVIRCDLLRRLLHKDVLQRLGNRPASSHDWLWCGDSMPYEFTHGAFRIGHGMPRSSYQLNEQPGQDAPLNIEVLLGAGNTPLPANWLVSWSKFFQLGGVPNYAKRFEPTQETALNTTSLLPDVAPGTPLYVSLRDWLSAANARMWRTDALVREIARRYPGLPFCQAEQVRAWLQPRVDAMPNARKRQLLRDHMDDLAFDLPLPLYVLIEAEQTGGTRAGPLASVIIGEVLLRCLAERQRDSHQKILVEGARSALGPADWDAIDAIRCMPDLIRLAESWGKLDQCQPLSFVSTPNP